MKILIEIDDSVASEIVQSVALAKGWSKVDDEQARVLLCQDIERDIVNLARNGQTIRKRNEEQAYLDNPLKGLTVS